MPLFQADIQKVYQGEYWTNRYIIQAVDLAAADVVSQQIVAIERDVHNTTVQFDKVRTSDMDPATDSYVVTTLGQFGLWSSSFTMLPLFNVARIDFNTGSGRPSRKYLRVGMTEESHEAMQLTAAYRTILGTSYGAPLLAIPEFVDVDNQSFISYSVALNVGMRQLRRGTRRRVTPVI